MSVTVVGSVNEDVLVAVDRLPGRGETVVGRSVSRAPGGKGANQAAAAGLLGCCCSNSRSRWRRSGPPPSPRAAPSSSPRLAQGLAGGADLAGAVRYAVAAAALSTTGPGARGALPDDDDVRAVLDRVPPPTGMG